MLSRMSGHSDDVPFAILFPDKKTPSNASGRALLLDSQHLSWKQTVTNQAGGFGVLNLHDLDQLAGWNVSDFHVNGFASQQDLYLVQVFLPNFGSVETCFDEETTNKRVGVFGAYCLQ